jgi:hypothetical protein
LSKQIKVRSFLVKLKLEVNEGIPTIYDADGFQVTPVDLKMAEGHIYTTLTNSPFRAIGYNILSVQDDYNEDDPKSSITFTYEVEILKESINTAQSIQYISTIVYPTIASYIIKALTIAKDVNEEVESKFTIQ